MLPFYQTHKQVNFSIYYQFQYFIISIKCLPLSVQYTGRDKTRSFILVKVVIQLKFVYVYIVNYCCYCLIVSTFVLQCSTPRTYKEICYFINIHEHTMKGHNSDHKINLKVACSCGSSENMSTTLDFRWWDLHVA